MKATDIGRHSRRRRPSALCVFAVACVTWCASAATAQPPAPATTPEEIVSRLAVAVTQGRDAETEALVADLTKCGETSVPSIRVGLARAEQLSVLLTRALGAIPGDESTSLLMQLAARGSPLGMTNRALAALENREVRRPLSAREFATLATRVAQANIAGAGLAARVLGKCAMVPASERLAPILERFESEVRSPTQVGADPTSYVSPRVRTLNQFLLAVSYIGEPAIPDLHQKRQHASGHSELDKWILLALGMAGDQSVAADLADMALGEPDRSVRCVAVHAYARSANEAAIPLLESLVTDTTESEYTDSHGGPILLIRLAAKDELSRLKRQTTPQRSQNGNGDSGAVEEVAVPSS